MIDYTRTITGNNNQVEDVLQDAWLRFEPTAARETVAETTVPESVPAPTGAHVSNNSDASWQALLLAHLE